jgi:hypothetical protein
MLSFEVDHYEDHPTPDIFAAVSAHNARLEYLKLHLWRANFSAIELSMPALRHLDIHLYESPQVDIFVCRDAPSLRTVLLDALAARHVILPWAQLTALTLYSVSPDQCVPILRQTSHLIHCKLILSEGDGVLPSEVQLPRLESLILDYVDEPIMSGYLETFIVPALRSLHVPESPIDEISSFISKSGCKLQHLAITGEINAIQDVREYRHAFPSISKLSLCGWHLSEIRHTKDISAVDELFVYFSAVQIATTEVMSRGS